MIKILRRVFALIFMLLTVFVVCYTVRTFNMIKDHSIPYESLQKSVYKSKNGYILILSGENVWYITEENSYTCVLESYESGNLKIQEDNNAYSFKVIDEETVYDMQTKEFMYRGGSG